MLTFFFLLEYIPRAYQVHETLNRSPTVNYRTGRRKLTGILRELLCDWVLSLPTFSREEHTKCLRYWAVFASALLRIRGMIYPRSFCVGRNTKSDEAQRDQTRRNEERRGETLFNAPGQTRRDEAIRIEVRCVVADTCSSSKWEVRCGKILSYDVIRGPWTSLSSTPGVLKWGGHDDHNLLSRKATGKKRAANARNYFCQWTTAKRLLSVLLLTTTALDLARFLVSAIRSTSCYLVSRT